jgi:LysR family nitrogen assimilation transcriptional regulator
MRSLELFAAAYEQRSFTLGAERAHATQSGVSQHISKLEALHGVKLFVREGGRVTPTPAADAFYRDCTALIRAKKAADIRLRSFSSGLSGEVRVGLMPTLSARALAPSLMAFKASHPNVSVHITEAFSGVLTEMVVACEIDFAIVPGIPTPIGLTASPFISTPELFVFGPHFKHETVINIDLRQIAPLRLVLPSAGNTRANTIRTFLATHGIAVHAVLELDSMMATLDLLAQSEWTAILPALMMARHSPGIDLDVRVVEPELTLDLVTLESTKRGLSPCAEAFLEAVRDQCRYLLSPPEAVTPI